MSDLARPMSAADGSLRWVIGDSIDPVAWMSSVGYNATSILASFNSLPPGD